MASTNGVLAFLRSHCCQLSIKYTLEGVAGILVDCLGCQTKILTKLLVLLLATGIDWLYKPRLLCYS